MLNKIGNLIGNTGMKLKQNSPELYLGAGLVAGAATVVLIARAWKRTEPIVQEYQVEKYILDENLDPDDPEEGIDASEYRTQHAQIAVKAGKELAKLYIPGIVAGTLSVGLILTAHREQSSRIKALASAAAVLQSGFATYRSRVVDELGEEADQRFYHGAEQRTVVEITKNEDGKTKKRKVKKNHISDEVSPIDYSRRFDHVNNNHTGDREWDQTFLEYAQANANSKLDLYGTVLLNDVYSDLGFPRTAYGAVMGWSKHMPDTDDFVDFGIDDDINQRDGTNVWVLDFNVNGVVWDFLDDA